MRLLSLLPALLALLVPASAAAAPRFSELAGDGIGYAVALDRTPDGPVVATLSDDAGGAATAQLPVASSEHPLRLAATGRCLPGGRRLLRVYGTAKSAVRGVRVHPTDGRDFDLDRVPVPTEWGFRGRAVGAVRETTGDRFRLLARDRRGRRVTSFTVTFATPCASDGAPVLAASVDPEAVTPDTTGMTARLRLPARPGGVTYSVQIVQPGWDFRRTAFDGDPWGSPLGAAGEAVLEGPGAIEGAAPALARIGDACIRGAAQLTNTVTVRLGAGESTTLAWPLALAPEPLQDRTQLAPAFRVSRDGYSGTIGGAVANYDGQLGVRFGLRARRRGEQLVVRGSTSPRVTRRVVTVYLFQARDRPAGERLLENDYRPFRTTRVRTDARGRFRARFSVDRRAYRVFAEVREPGPGLVADRSCPLTRDYRR